MSVTAALREGIARTWRASSLIAAAWFVAVATAMPLTLAVGASIYEHLGASLMAGKVADGADYDWLDEFAADSAASGGIAATVGPSVIGFAAVVDNISGFLDRIALHPTIATTLLVYLVLWTFVSGGIFERLARGGESGRPFLSACGEWFGRLLRIFLLQVIVFGALFAVLYPWLFYDLFYELTADVAVERTAFFIRLACYLAFAFVLALAHVLFDYAKVRMVVEDRRSALGAVRAALRFLHRNAARTATLYALNVLLLVAVLAVYAVVAPGAGAGGWGVWAGFAVSQLYIAARLWARLVFWASEMALFARTVTASR